MSEQIEDEPVPERQPVKHFSSASAQGFFASDIHTKEQMPSDAVEIAEEKYRALFDGTKVGHPIIWDETGPSLGPIPTPSPEIIAANLRLERDRRLAASDWTQLGDAPLSAPDRNRWATYRQALRNLPAETSDPANPVWPIAP